MNTLAKRLVALLNKSPLIKERAGTQLIAANSFHQNQLLQNKINSQLEIASHHFNVERKVKEVFLKIINIYKDEDPPRKNQLQFIENALKYMDEFGVNKDIESYKALFSVFPKGKYVPANKYQALAYHYLKHQNTAIAILNKMEQNFVIPDTELYQMVTDTFGIRSYVIKKCMVMLYWLPKFSELNPWPLPYPPPTDTKELAQFAITKMARADVQADVTIYRTEDIPDVIDKTWIVSAMSKTQQELLAVQPTNKSLSVEGPFPIWVDKYFLEYFVLKGEPIQREVIYGEYDDVSNLKMPFWERHHFKIPVTIHEQDDGVYYAMCATGTSSKDSLLSWIRCLQKTNPILEKMPVTFKVRSATVQTQGIEGQTTHDIKQIAEDRNMSDK